MSRFPCFCRSAGFGPQEGQFVGVVLNLLLDADASRVAAREAVVKQYGPTAGGCRLQQCRHLARMQGIDARIAVAREKHDGRIIGARLHVLIGRVLVEIRKLLLVFGGAVFGGPVRTLLELLVAQHVQQADSRTTRPKTILDAA